MSDTTTGDKVKVLSSDEMIKRLVVAVHGIGSQFRYATVHSVVSRFMAQCGRKMMLVQSCDLLDRP